MCLAMVFCFSNSVTGCVNSYATNIGNQTAVTPSTEPGIQSGDWTLNISGIRFTSNGKYVSGMVESMLTFWYACLH